MQNGLFNICSDDKMIDDLNRQEKNGMDVCDKQQQFQYTPFIFSVMVVTILDFAPEAVSCHCN